MPRESIALAPAAQSVLQLAPFPFTLRGLWTLCYTAPLLQDVPHVPNELPVLMIERV
jgi:hypothetical protein